MAGKEPLWHDQVQHVARPRLRTADYIIAGLTVAGHLVDRLSSGREGLVQATVGGYGILIVDRILPGLDGCRSCGPTVARR